MSLIIIEGPDGAGKTTLIEKIHNRHRHVTIHHHGAYLGEKKIAQHYLRSIYHALTKPNVITIMDRSWLAEPIYGEAMRGGENRIPIWQRRMLERAAMGADAFIIKCLPEFEVCQRAWSKRLAKEYPQKEAQLRKIYDGYAKLDVPWAPTIKYNWTNDEEGHSLEEIDEMILKSRREEPTIGARSDTGPVLLIGDRPGGQPNPRRIDLPFISLSTESGCSAWLTMKLEEWGIPEQFLAWANQNDLDLLEFEDIDRYRRVIALGGYATEWCEQNGLNFYSAYHPQYWKRFHFNQPYYLRELLSVQATSSYSVMDP